MTSPSPVAELPKGLESRFVELVERRLQESNVLPELHQALMWQARQDAVRLATGRHWSWVIPSIQHLLGRPEADIVPFLAAWSVLHLATSRLDHLQDDDPVDEPSLPKGAAYNLALSAYALATGLLDALPSTSFAPHRLLRLHRLWSSHILSTAGGQQRDLMHLGAGGEAASLMAYQEAAQAKSGAMFALAFGGTAALLDDNQEIIDRYSAIGELFGTLVQYWDDVLDIDLQPEGAATLPSALEAAAQAAQAGGSAQSAASFWRYLYEPYLSHLADLSAPLSEREQSGLRSLFAYAFEQPS